MYFNSVFEEFLNYNEVKNNGFYNILNMHRQILNTMIFSNIY